MRRFGKGHLLAVLIALAIGDVWLTIPSMQRALSEPFLFADWREYVTAVTLLRAGQGHLLYDPQAFEAFQRGMGMDISLPYYYHPVFLIVALPFASLPPGLSYGIWVAFNITLLALCLHLLRAKLPEPDRLAFFVLAAAQLPVWVALYLGQASFVLLLGQTLAAIGWLERNDRKAVLGLILLTVKPQLLIPWLALLLLRREWRKVMYLAAGGAGILAASVALIGTTGVNNYLQLLQTEQARSNYPWSHSVMGLLTMLTGSANPLPEYLLLVALVLTTSWFALRRTLAGRAEEADQIALAATTVASTLLANHLLIYDLALWIVPIAIGWRVASPTAGRIFIAAALVAPYLSLISPPFVVPSVLTQAAALIYLLLIAVNTSRQTLATSDRAAASPS